MVQSLEVTLDVAKPAEAVVIANLWELYAHDLSDVFALELGADARFGNENLSVYWSEPERRFPFLIRYGARIAGFALVTRGSSASENPEVLDIAEFFIARRYRRLGVGRQAALLVWQRFPGRWTVRVSEGNGSGCRFWASVITHYTGGTQTETQRPGQPHAWRVFSFNSVNRKAIGASP